MPKVTTPEEFNCPITHQLLVDPVIAVDFHTYERAAIKKWFSANNTSPMSNENIVNKTLRTNLFAKKSIEQFLEANKVCKEEKFWEAIEARNAEELKQLRFLERYLESKNASGYTPLHYAVESGDESIIKILLQEGAYVDIREDNYGGSPLMWAIKDGNITLAKILLQGGAKVDFADNESWTALHYAAENGRTEAASFLLDHNANIHALDENGRTPLHFAAKAGWKETVKLLLERGADYHIKDNDNLTPAQLAEEGFPPLAKLIPKYRQNLKIVKLNEVVTKQKGQLELQQAKLEKQQAEIEDLKKQIETEHNAKRIKLNT
jgi:hypothetical protein